MCVICKGRIRSEILLSLSSEGSNHHIPNVDNAATRANTLLNELIAEYLEFNGFRGALSVFLPESGISNHRIPKALVAQQMRINVAEDSHDIPLLYSILAIMQMGKVEKIQSQGDGGEYNPKQQGM